MSGVELSGVSKSFSTTPVLDGLDLVVPDGAVVAVLGASGSGKTTLLRTVAGFERPDAGTVAIDSRLVDAGRLFVPPERRRLGYVAQEGALFPHLDVAGNVGFGLARTERQRRVAELLELVGLEGLGHRYPHELSGGQRQRVALARALAPRPGVVLLDEPFSALDAGLRASLRADVVRILRAEAVTTVLVTHDQEEALSVSDLVGVIAGGAIRQLAPPAELYARPADAGLAGFLGEANLVEGTAAAGTARTPFGDLTLASDAAGLEGPVIVLIRPEQLSVGPPDRPRAPGVGRVVHSEYYGHDSVLLVEVPDGPAIRVRCAGRPAARLGDEVRLLAGGETVAWPRRPASA